MLLGHLSTPRRDAMIEIITIIVVDIKSRVMVKIKERERNDKGNCLNYGQNGKSTFYCK